MAKFDPTVLNVSEDAPMNYTILPPRGKDNELRRIRKELKKICRLLMYEIMLKEQWRQSQTSVLFDDTLFSPPFGLPPKRKKKKW